MTLKKHDDLSLKPPKEKAFENYEAFLAYDKLVEHDDDLVGSLAYSLYRRQKRAYIYENGYSTDHPDALVYHKMLTPESIDAFRKSAKDELKLYAEAIAEQTIAEVKDGIESHAITKGIMDHIDKQTETIKESHAITEGIKKHIDQQTEIIKEVTSGKKNIVYNICGGFLLGLLILVISQLNSTNPLSNIFNKDESKEIIEEKK